MLVFHSSWQREVYSRKKPTLKVFQKVHTFWSLVQAQAGCLEFHEAAGNYRLTIENKKKTAWPSVPINMHMDSISLIH